MGLVMSSNDKVQCILVAEDDPSDAFFLQRAFKRAGIPLTLQFVRDGQEALDYLNGVGGYANRQTFPPPQLVLLDLKMPRLDGFETLAQIRKVLHLEVPVIVFSSSNLPTDVGRAYDLGANSYFVKPHSLEELNAFVAGFKNTGLPGGKARQPKAA
jgi:CheY-like chemotaxis protein